MPPEVQAFLEGVSVWTLIVWGAAIVLVIGVIAKAWSLVKKLSNFLDDVMGEPARPGVPPRLGLMERVMRVEHELFPNSGKSLRDQTNRMEQKLDADNARIADLSDQIGAVEEKVGGVDEKVTSLDERLDEHITKSTEIIQTLKEKP